jgi:hypothetical protein
MNNRSSFEFEETVDNVTLNIVTKCPSKWLLVDRETGQVYQGNAGGYWDKLKTVERVDK